MRLVDLGNLIVIATILGGVVAGVATWVRQANRREEMAHLERLKALEMGVAPRPAGLNWPAAATCIAIGAGVPVGSFAVCWLATLTAHAPDGLWVAPVFVSFSAIGAGRKLAVRFIDPNAGARKPARAPSTMAGKPEFDPDAFDVVGSRG